MTVETFGVSGESFERVLRDYGFGGDIELVGAPFFTELGSTGWDCAR